ncbi:MAG: hypothetical protein H0V61_09950 [Chitinophagales bacterium]|nr:hypothetical protein [Chitinophagales bacterium]
MKKLILISKSLLILTVMVMVSPIYAQIKTLATASETSVLNQVRVTIPQEWKNFIIQEDAGNTTTFSLVDGDIAPVFLFSITQIPENQWIKTNANLTDAQIIAQEDGVIYFSQVNKRETIKGPNSSLYQQIYPAIDEMIKSVQID